MGREQTYSSTILLPRTPFPLRADAVRREKLWSKQIGNALYEWQWSQKERPVFILHDGPPYANGNLHAGHGLNKVIKDIINRYKVLRGFRVHYVPGWDCHGLPIEMKVLELMKKAKKDISALSAIEIRNAAREHARQNVQLQLAEFNELGIMVDWDNRYQTYDHHFEISQLKVFQKMIDRGLITRARKPVYYSPSSMTALAESELEYNETHKSRSVYLAFPVVQRSPELSERLQNFNGQVSLAIWTTTPWTIPANMAVAISPDLEYSLVHHSSKGYLVVASSRIDELRTTFCDPLPLKCSFPGSTLLGSRYRPPLSNGARSCPVISSPYVSADTGTGLVHSAPAHGFEDWSICHAVIAEDSLSEALLTTVTDQGRFSNSLRQILRPDIAEELNGKSVMGDGVKSITHYLREESLIAEVPITHKYPYDWRTKQPVMIRVTPQWFANLESIKDQALSAVETVQFTPESGRARLESFVRSRTEWCISRQRAWGVPIPALINASTGEALLTSQSIAHIISVLEQKGLDYWWIGPVEEFVPPEHQEQTWLKGMDTMDVWFDSGTSWTTIRELVLPRNEALPLTDLYLEGSDQHRGWFQSSLLTSVSTEGKSPYCKVLTHGFVLDGSGQKMSKSLGNVISHLTVINGGDNKKQLPAYGRDVFRLWAASVDYTGDVLIGPSIIGQVSENLKKIRNTFRFLLGYVTPYPLPLQYEHHTLMESFVLHEIWKLETACLKHYDDFAFNKVVQDVNRFVNSTLSGLYFDSVKDVLYSNGVFDNRRQTVIAVFSQLLETLLKVLSPILPHLCEEVRYYRAGHECDPDTDTLSKQFPVFSHHWDSPNAAWENVLAEREMNNLLNYRHIVHSLIEEARQQKLAVNATEVEVEILATESEEAHVLSKHVGILAQLLMTSSVSLEVSQEPVSRRWELAKSDNGSTIKIYPSRFLRCHRCWRHDCREGEVLCSRCDSVLSNR
ncbi:isoleucyl-tRNA synthetase [Atractiella rhizophila]|nr:isoleucyl-tRNA synthetase [Atractiella rhizophila]